MKFKKSFKIQNQIFFAQRLSLLLNANISLIDSLKFIKFIENSKERIKVYDQIISDCERGLSLSKSIEQSNSNFDNLLIVFIKNGEYSGNLINSLNYISENLEKKNELFKKMISTLIYPIFIFITTIFMAIFLVMYIFPKILPMLNSLNIELPLPTKIIKIIYELSSSYGLYFIIFSIIIYFLLRLIIKRSIKMMKIIDNLYLRLPIIGDYIKINTCRTFCSVTQVFLDSDRSVSDIFKFSLESSNNLVYKDAFNNMNILCLRGIAMHICLKNYEKIFLKTMIDMCELGEKTSNLSIMMKNCSKIFEQDLDIILKRISSILEPTLMIFMGLIVGSIALSIILPIYEITNNLKN